MPSRESRRPPSSRSPALLLLGPLALLVAALLGLMASSASADHAVAPPGALSVSPGPTGSDRLPSWTFTLEDGDTALCTLTAPDGGVVHAAVPCSSPYVPAAPLSADGTWTLAVTAVRADVQEPDPSDTSTVLVHTGGTSAQATRAYVLDTLSPDPPTFLGTGSTGSATTLTWAFEQSGDGTGFLCRLLQDGSGPTGFTGCTSNYTVTVTEEGAYALEVVAVDAAGNVSPVTTGPVHVVDTSPPDAPLVTSDRSGTGQPLVVTYRFSGEGEATCLLTRDGAPVGDPAPCTSPWTVTLPTTDGSYVLLVTYTDAVGNDSDPGRSPAYLLDLTAPAAPAVQGPSGTGNAATVRWTFVGEGTATCQLLLDGASYAPVVEGCTSGAEVLLPRDGSWSLQVELTDAAGNRGPPGTSAPYLLDTVPAGAPTLLGPIGPSPSRTPAWTVTADPGATTQCRVVAGSTVILDWARCAGSFVADLTGLADGSYVVEARAVDAAGNVGPTGGSAPYVLDTAAPGAATVAGPTGPSASRTPTFTWNGEPGSRAECQLSREGVAVGGWAACSSGYTPTLPSDGTWTLTVRLLDAAGNVGAIAASPGYVLDTTAPPAPVVTPPSSPGRDRAPSWGATVEPGSSVECRLSGPGGVLSEWAPCTLPHTTPLDGRPDGTYVLEVRVTDAAGNLGGVGRGTYVLDTVAPSAPVVQSPATPGRSRSPTFTFSVEPGATTRCRLTSGATVLYDGTACGSPATLNLTGLPDGTYTLTVRVTDAAGNPGPSATGTYVLDTTGPAAPVLTLSPATPSPAHRPTWAFTYEAGSALVCRLTAPGGSVRDITGCSSPLTVDLTGSPDGTYSLTVRAVDVAGNVGAALTATYVLDGSALAGPAVVGPATPGKLRTPRWLISTTAPTECRLSRGATVLRDWAPCDGSYTADLFGQPDGTYALAVRVVSSGRVSAATVSSYVLDTVAPAPATLVAPPSPSTNPTPVWSIASPDPGVRAECRVLVFGSVLTDWRVCAVSVGGSLLPVALTGGDGTYTLVVRLIDAAGNPGAEARSSYVLDTSAPAAVGVTPPPSPGADRTPTWLLATGVGAQLECRLTSGDEVVADWEPCAREYTPSLSGLPDGTYTLYVRALSSAGTPGPYVTSPYVLSVTPPGAPTTPALVGTTSPGKTRSPTWIFTLPSGTTGRCTVVVGASLVFDGTCLSPFVLDLSNADDGSYTLTVRALDAAGNLSPPVTATYVLDVTPPPAPTFTLVPGALGSTLTPQWRFAVGYGSTAQCRLQSDGRTIRDWAACVDLYAANLSGQPDGRYVLDVRAVDGAGNTSAPRSSSYFLDRTAVPVVTFTAVPETPSGDPAARWTFVAPPGTSLECRLTTPDGDTGWLPCEAVPSGLRTASAMTVASAGSYALDLTGRPDGDYLLDVRVVDADGRRGSPSRFTYTRDTEVPAPPTISVPPAPAGNTPDPTWVWDSPTDDAVECRLVRVGAGPVTEWADCTSPYTADLSSRPQGTYALELRAVDAAGNLSRSVSATYLYDTVAPPRPVFTARQESGADRTVRWTFAVPADTTATCAVTRGRTVVVREQPCNGVYDLDLTGQPDGLYALTVRYTDRAGNDSEASSSYALSTTGSGPVRVDPPRPPPAAPGGVTGPGRGGTGVGSRPDLGPPTGEGGATPPATGADADDVPRDSERSSTGDPAPGGAPRATDETVAAGTRGQPRPGDFERFRDVVTGTISRPTLPLALLAIVVLFLLAQNRIDRRDPKLATAPVEAEPELDFTLVIQRPGGALS